jgi:DNA-binding CsgD family transcriptional regulator
MAHGRHIVDRPTEFGRIRSALTDGADGGVVLIGAAGVGKTTLARNVTGSLPADVRWVAGSESARSIPLGAFAHLIGSSTTRDPIGLLASARDSLVAQGNTVVGVDDAHLLDELSATLLHQVAMDRAARIVATIRSGEPVPDAVTSLWKDGYLIRLDLEPFTRAQSVTLIETILGGQVEQLSAEVMWETSGGNALFLRHLVEGAVEAGTLNQANGVWQLRGGTVVTTGLAELLESRLAELGPETMVALKLLALCEPLDLDVLAELAGEEAVDRAELRGLIHIVADGPDLAARFSHPLYGDVVRRRMGTASARKLRGRLVQVLRDRVSMSAAARIRIAQLYLDSDRSADSKLLITAAKDAISLSNVPLGERFARGALQTGGGLDAAELLSRALHWQGHPAQAEAVLTRFDPNQLDELQLVRWGIPLLSIVFWSMRDVDRANQIFALLQQRTTHPGLKLAVQSTGSAMAVHENRIAEGLDAATAVLADPLAPTQAVEWAAFACGLAMPVAGRGAEFQPIAERSRTQGKATDGMIRAMVRYGHVLSLAGLGELDLAEQRVSEYSEFSSAGQFLGWAISGIMAAVVATYRGHCRDVIRLTEQALAALDAESPLPWQLPARILLANAYSASGQADKAAGVISDAAEHTGAHMAIHAPQLMLCRAWLAAANGSGRAGMDLAVAAARAARECGQFAVEADALHLAARFGDRTVAGRLAELAEVVDGRIVPVQARHATAVAAGDGPLLDQVSREFESIGLMLCAADAAAQAVASHEHTGARRAGVESAARATRLAALCGGAGTPAIRSAAQPLPLTAREREIAMLVTAGLTNREIAEQLTLSVRTIENHLYRACIKLDVTDRDDLARVIRQA